MRHVTEEMTSLGEVQQRKVREKDSELRRLKKAELQLRQARDGVQHVQQMLDNKQADVRIYTPSVPTVTVQQQQRSLDQSTG